SRFPYARLSHRSSSTQMRTVRSWKSCGWLRVIVNRAGVWVTGRIIHLEPHEQVRDVKEDEHQPAALREAVRTAQADVLGRSHLQVQGLRKQRVERAYLVASRRHRSGDRLAIPDLAPLPPIHV